MAKVKNIPVKTKEETLSSNKDYAMTLAELKKQIQNSQIRAISAANKKLLRLYWTIGKTIVEKQEQSGWSTKFIEKLVRDLQNAFPGIEGFSQTNIFRMRAFYREYKIVPQPVGQLHDLGD